MSGVRVQRLLRRLLSSHPLGRYKNPGSGELEDLDVNFYREYNQDLAHLSDAALRRHWVRHGKREGRPSTLEAFLAARGLDTDQIGPAFDWRVYLARYGDLRKAGIANRSGALAHYLQFGIKEGRRGDFNEAFYTAYYQDLAEFSGNREAAIGHWLTFGHSEGRSPTLRCLAESCGADPGLVSDEMEWPVGAASLSEYWINIARTFTQQPPGLVPVSGDSQSDAFFYLKLAESFTARGRDGRAEGIYIALAGSFPALAHRCLGDIAARAGWARSAGEQRLQLQREALSHYRASLRIEPDSWQAKAGEARTLVDLGRDQEALVASELLLANHPEIGESERAMERSAKAFWRAGWADANCLATSDERQQLLNLATTLAGKLDHLYRTLILRGAEAPVRARLNREYVLIVADCQLPQCVRYRIDQKVEQLEHVGYRTTVMSWKDSDEASQALAFHDQIIFYRVPAFPEIVRLISSARALGKLTIYEIDDLLFDPAYPPALDSYGGYVDAREYRELMKGGALYRAAAMLCDYGLVSTAPLAERLAQVVRTGICHVHRNALDRLSPSDRLRHADGALDTVNIFYGSATRAHNSDFVEQALPALLRVLAEHPRARLTIAGYLQLPPEAVRQLGDRLVQVPMQSDVSAYLELLAEADINLAVLHPDLMTDCKSELKWLEAGVMGIPSIVSPTRNYLDVVRDGVDALVAGTPDEWHTALVRLVTDAGLRSAIGQAARERALENYSVPAMAASLRAILDAAADSVESAAQRGR